MRFRSLIKTGTKAENRSFRSVTLGFKCNLFRSVPASNGTCSIVLERPFRYTLSLAGPLNINFGLSPPPFKGDVIYGQQLIKGPLNLIWKKASPLGAHFNHASVYNELYRNPSYQPEKNSLSDILHSPHNFNKQVTPPE